MIDRWILLIIFLLSFLVNNDYLFNMYCLCIVY
nr:MAG TPA: hypothetical protein [Caudoviricetes sp.]